MTLAEALAAGQHGRQFIAGGQTFVLPPGVQGPPTEEAPVEEAPRTVEEALAVPRIPLPVGLNNNTFDVLGQATTGATAARSIFDGLGNMFDPTDPRNAPDSNTAGNIGMGLSVVNTALGGPTLLGSGLSMAGQGISANRRTSALDDILRGAGLSETPEGTAANDWWSQGVTGLFGAGEPAQAAAAREIAEEASRPEGRTEDAMSALAGMSDRVTEELERQGHSGDRWGQRLVAGAYSEPQPFYSERTMRNMALPDPGNGATRPASMYSAPVVDALANLADVGALPGPGMSVALNTPIALNAPMAVGFGPRTASPQYAPEEQEYVDQLTPDSAMDAWAAQADKMAESPYSNYGQAAAQQAAMDHAAEVAAAEGFTDYQGGIGNQGYDSFSDWSDAAFG